MRNRALAFVVIGVLVGCAAQAPKGTMAVQAPGMEAPPPPVAPAGPMAVAPSPAPPGTAPATTQANAKFAASASGATELLAPAIIYVGTLAMLVDEDQMAAALDKAIDIAESIGGFQSSRKDTSVELRVPAPKFRDALRKLEALGQVTNRSVNAQDVSEEIHDAEVRITNLKATQKRLQEFLAKAHNITDTLTVERELERVALELDRLEGRLRFLKTRASYSTIVVNVGPRPRAATTVAAGPPPRRVPIVELPIPWLDDLGAARLVNLK